MQRLDCIMEFSYAIMPFFNRIMEFSGAYKLLIV